MTARRSSTVVPYTPQQMYELVGDVEAYPEFLPWCLALRVVKRTPQEKPTEMLADMVVAYKVFRERFRSRVTLDHNEKSINAHYTDGPFRKLVTEWQFDPAPQGGCEINFFIEFVFSNMFLHSTASMVFERAFARMTDAFVERAHGLYGAENASAPVT